MKIYICGISQPFKNLKQGDAFKFNNLVYIKTNEIVSDFADGNETYNCVDLESDSLCGLLKDTPVQPLLSAVLKTEE